METVASTLETQMTVALPVQKYGIAHNVIELNKHSQNSR